MRPTKANMHSKHIFISYSTQNREFVLKLRNDLHRAGLSLWIDQDGLRPGIPNWEKELRQAIRGAYALVLVATPAAYDSRYVQGELEVARMYDCPIFPIWADGVQWGECVPLDLIKTQYVDLREPNYSSGLEGLIHLLADIEPTSDALSGATTTLSAGISPRNPFKGLLPFTEADKNDFFGREALIKDMLEALRMSNFLAVIGPSGSGKSSLVMAGLLPLLRNGYLPDSQNWILLDPLRPSSEPIENLAIILADALGTGINGVLEDIERSVRGLHLTIRRLVKQSHKKAILFVDQFEELFTQTVDESKRRQFVELVVNAVSEPDSSCILILTMRADFYDRPMKYEALGRLIDRHARSILPMRVEEIRSAIETPVQRVGLQIENSLVGDLIYEVKSEPGALPLLQFALDQLFRRRNGLTMTSSSYSLMGGLRGALVSHAEMTYAALPTDEHRDMTRKLCLRIVELGASERDTTRRRAKYEEMQFAHERQNPILRDVVNAFVNARLLTISEAGIEISHEALIREWPRFIDWISTSNEELRFAASLRRDANEWERKGKRIDELYRGRRLVEAQEFAFANPMSSIQWEFIKASQEFTEQESRKRLALQNVVSAIALQLQIPVDSILTQGNLLLEQINALESQTEIELVPDMNRLISKVSSIKRALSDLIRTQQVLDGNLIVSIETVDIQNLLFHAIRQYQFEIKEARLQVRVLVRDADRLTLECDPELLLWALGHLIKNSISYTESEGEIFLTAKSDKSAVIVQVGDTGVGIAPSELPHVLEPFFRGKAFRSNGTPIEISGLGVGLTIVNEVMGALNGSMLIQSELGRGTIVALHFPSTFHSI